MKILRVNGNKPRRPWLVEGLIFPPCMLFKYPFQICFSSIGQTRLWTMRRAQRAIAIAHSAYSAEGEEHLSLRVEMKNGGQKAKSRA